jgi:hypothetical protein
MGDCKTCRLQGRSHLPPLMLMSSEHEHSASNAEGCACMTAETGVAEPGPQQQRHFAMYFIGDIIA